MKLPVDYHAGFPGSRDNRAEASSLVIRWAAGGSRCRVGRKFASGLARASAVKGSLRAAIRKLVHGAVAGWLGVTVLTAAMTAAERFNNVEGSRPLSFLLERPTCRIALGAPGPNGEGWASTPQLPEIRPTQPNVDAPPQTEVRALADETALYIQFDCVVREPVTLIEGADGGDRVWVEIHPRNDPVERWRLETDFRGDRKVARLYRITGECSLQVVPDVWEKSSAHTFAIFEAPVFHGVKTGGWQAEFVVPWKSLGLKNPPPSIGLGYGRIFGSTALRPAHREAAWPDVDPLRPWTRFLDPGQALLGDEAVAPIGWTTLTPQFGVNRGRLRFSPDAVKEALKLVVRTEAASGKPLDAGVVTVPAGAVTADFSYRLARSLESHVDVFGPQRVVIELVGKGDALRYTARVPFARHLGVCIDEPFDEPSTGLPAAVGHDAWLERVVRNLPRLIRRTTQQGAPSDFCLCYRDGKIAANLMADDAWRQLAGIIESRFATADDRLVASMALVGQKSVTNLILGPLFLRTSGEQDYHTAHHEMMGPLSLVRYGGGPAVSRAAVLARLLQHLSDPQTGRPFITRVISLTNDGGPFQTDRRYTASRNLSPFIQVPGAIGAVTVDHAGSQTLLDPTALAFFGADGRLATVEEIQRNASLRQEGAGRLADVYGKINIEEIRRQPVDRLLSRGVFPEQAAEEDGVERPYEMGARFSVPTIVAGVRGGGPGVTGFLDEWRRPGRRSGDVTVEDSAEGWRVTVKVRGVPLAELAGPDLTWERVHVVVDGEHRHVAFRHFMAAAAGGRGAWREESTAIQTLCKHLATENWREVAAIGTRGWSAEFKAVADGYDVHFQLSREVLDVSVSTPSVGFNVWVEGRKPCYEQVFLSPPGRRLPADPMTFADLYLSGSPVVVEGVDLGVPTWLENEGRLRLANRSEHPVTVRLQVSNRLGMRRKTSALPAIEATVPDGRVTVPFSFLLDPEEKMGSGGRQELMVEATAGECTFYRSAWGAAYHGPVSVYQRYGAGLGSQLRPVPGDPYFGEKMIRWICSRLPRFAKLTTRDGARSDFVLRAEDGSAEFNLMEQTAMAAMAAYIEKRFTTDFERILGLYCLALQPAVGRHNSGGHHLMFRADPLSILRGNFAGAGGNCGYHAALFAALVAQLNVAGRPVSAHTISVWGHVVTAIDWRGTRALLDNDVGHLFFTPDGGDFATIEEFRANPRLLSSAGAGEIGRYYNFSDEEARAQVTGVGGITGCGIFPASDSRR